MLYQRIWNRIRLHTWQKNRNEINEAYRKKLKRQNFSIISMNCTGGILYHDLGMKFLSPTINMFMKAEDYIRFCEHLDEYLAIEQLSECGEPDVVANRSYPVAMLGDIHLFLVHYQSIQEAQDAWNRRKVRIVPERIVLMATDRDGMTNDLIERFEKLPYPKVMFVHQEDSQHQDCFYLRGYEDQGQVGIITERIGWKGFRPIDQFDWVNFLNSASRE